MIGSARRTPPAAASSPTEVSFARKVELNAIPDPGGVLVVAEASKQIGFTVRRVYFLTDLDPGSSRGRHGHRRLRQCFVCLRGSVTIAVTKGGERAEFHLNRFDEALQVDAGCWRELYDLSADALIMVLASDEYDELDYIRDYDAFCAWEREEERRVPYIDLRRYTDLMEGNLEGAVQDVLASGVFIGGNAVRQFEQAFARYCESSSAVGVGNGLDALSLLLRAKGIGAGDEVIVPAHTFVATALAVDAVGATPVLVDVDEGSALIDAELIGGAITDRTKAIIPVHLYGHPADMDAIKAEIGDRDIMILEDAAQAHGARYKGRRCGSLGDAAAFSFYPTKNLGALGDAGAITAGNADLAEQVRLIGNYGSREKYLHELPGVNSRLDPLNAKVLLAKLRYIDDWNAVRRKLADLYMSGLDGIDGLKLPRVHSWAEPVWHVFPVRVEQGRDDLLKHLASRGIGSNIHYPTPVHRQPCYQGRWAGEFPNADRLGRTLLSLPLDAVLSEREVCQVIAAVREFFGASGRGI